MRSRIPSTHQNINTMNSHNSLCLICGPAASGKSTLVTRLSSIQCIHYNPSQSFIDLGKEFGYSSFDCFSKIPREKAEQHFVQICSNNSMVISDQHLAIQFKKDSVFSGDLSSKVIETYEEYKQAVSDGLFRLLQQKNIRVMILFLYASPKVLLSRAHARFYEVGHQIRNQNEIEVAAEMNAERSVFSHIVNTFSLPHLSINTELYRAEETYNAALQFINANR